ncbi:MAG: tRNA uracil 4-sulfurtransferase ThiI [Eubacteriales bacterium]
MKEMILLKLGELVLKGLNRRSFEEKLQSNVARRVHPYGRFRIYTRQSTMYIESKEDSCDIYKAFEALKTVFGIAGLSIAYACDKDKDAILAACKEHLATELSQSTTFKVITKRADKTFPLNSIQLSQYVGGELHEAFPNLVVDVHNPVLEIHVEVRDFAAYVHANPVLGAGGLPVGINGKAVSLLSGGIDSPVASYMLAKRGITLEMVHFSSPPYTSEQAKEKVISLASHLTPYCGRMVVHVVPFTEIQEHLKRNCPQELFTVLMRRMMMRISCRVVERIGAKALVTGECLGQVASQTMEAMYATEAVATYPIFRPVVGMDKEEIVTIARKIGTFETSILPYEDCCTVFTPKHPRLRPNLGELERAEEKLDVETLVNSAYENIERVLVELKSL